MYKCLDKYAPSRVVFQNEGLKPRVPAEDIELLTKRTVALIIKNKEVGASEPNSR